MSLKLPPVLLKEFVNLPCINKPSKEDENKEDKVVCGHVDTAEQARKTVQLSDLAPIQNGQMSNCMVVQEEPGSGKTMFCQKCVGGGDKVNFSSITHW